MKSSSKVVMLECIFLNEMLHIGSTGHNNNEAYEFPDDQKCMTPDISNESETTGKPLKPKNPLKKHEATKF